MRNYCRKCGGYGQINNPDMSWWKLWDRIECLSCGGDGFAKPPGWPDREEMKRLRPPVPPPPPPRYTRY